jgi:hypothetical protein
MNLTSGSNIRNKLYKLSYEFYLVKCVQACHIQLLWQHLQYYFEWYKKKKKSINKSLLLWEPSGLHVYENIVAHNKVNQNNQTS